MARKRMIHPHFWESAQDKNWNSDMCTVMAAAISCADDEGRGRLSDLENKVQGIVSSKKFKKSVILLTDSIIIFRKMYFLLPNFSEYQKISHPTPSKIPKPSDEEIRTYLEKLPELIRNYSTTVKFSLNKINIVKVNGADVDNSVDNFNSQPFNVDLPLITDIKEYAPSDYNDTELVTISIKNLLYSFLNLDNPDKKIIKSFVNIVMNTNQVKNQTAFKFLFEEFYQFHSYSDEKRNLKYLYTRICGKINDGLIKAREERAKMIKQKEKSETIPNVSEDITQLVNKMKIN